MDKVFIALAQKYMKVLPVHQTAYQCAVINEIQSLGRRV